MAPGSGQAMGARSYVLNVDSPLGRLTVTATDKAIIRLGWNDGADQSPSPLLQAAADQINAYFSGSLQAFDLPLQAAGTNFQKRVWSAMLEIPYGETRTYGELASLLGTGARAVGGACRANPIPIIVPCHRVVGSADTPGGYSGKGGLSTKHYLLALEESGRRMTVTHQNCITVRPVTADQKAATRT